MRTIEGPIKCPYCGLRPEVQIEEVSRSVAVTGALRRISEPLKKPTAAKMSIRLPIHKITEVINRIAMKISSLADDRKRLEIANSWFDLKCPRCGNSYRFNFRTRETHK